MLSFQQSQIFKKGSAMKTAIDYEKYANMDTRQLANALMSAERREQKYVAESKEKIKNMREIIRFLKSKIKESVDKPQFISYTESKAYKVARELEKQFTPQELEEIRQEVRAEMMRSDDEL